MSAAPPWIGVFIARRCLIPINDLPVDLPKNLSSLRVRPNKVWVIFCC